MDFTILAFQFFMFIRLESDIKLHLSYEKKRFVARVVQLNDFYLIGLKNKSWPNWMTVSARLLTDYDQMKPQIFAMNIDLGDYADKSFVLEAPVSESENNCENPPVEGLKGVLLCCQCPNFPIAGFGVQANRSVRHFPAEYVQKRASKACECSLFARVLGFAKIGF